ncbi:hypothetical protein [Clostridium gasigenes]|uniref:hypothetical protein n=1 Tax=Clostridium gasigenes TaxID=94869 RepID=UPI001C0C2E82|nr:hypothetical protein [Clostridium gasigenes]MBU3107174.1 hypothetical protein [Clostridium gasigenes]
MKATRKYITVFNDESKIMVGDHVKIKTWKCDQEGIVKALHTESLVLDMSEKFNSKEETFKYEDISKVEVIE